MLTNCHAMFQFCGCVLAFACTCSPGQCVCVCETRSINWSQQCNGIPDCPGGDDEGLYRV